MDLDAQFVYVFMKEKKQGQPEAIAVFPWRKPCAAQGQQ